MAMTTHPGSEPLCGVAKRVAQLGGARVLAYVCRGARSELRRAGPGGWARRRQRWCSFERA
eukprot:4360311-Prorocentrum_lima.AAC.1